MLEICLRCPTKDCEKSLPNAFDFCAYGVAYYNDGNNIRKKEELVTLRHVSHNLRHELNKVLQTILTEAVKIDNKVSTKKIDLDSPASRIVGATVIIDQFIEMISGVNEFHPSHNYSSNLDKKNNLYKIVDKYSKIYSLIENTRRAKNLKFQQNINQQIDLSFASHIVEYLISLLMDNIWKYSIDGTEPQIIAARQPTDDVNIIFKNISKPISNLDKIFEKGYQQERQCEGFGYGLYWARILTTHYNELSQRITYKLELEHTQKFINSGTAEQIFTLRNVRA